MEKHNPRIGRSRLLRGDLLVKEQCRTPDWLRFEFETQDIPPQDRLSVLKLHIESRYAPEERSIVTRTSLSGETSYS